MKIDFLAAILFLGCTLNCSGVSSAAVPVRPELKQVFLRLQTLAPKEANAFLLASGFEKGPSPNRRTSLYVGRLDQDSIHVFFFKKRRVSSVNMYQIEIVKSNFNWYQVKNNIYSLEFEIKSWLEKSPVTRITQPPRDCLGNELHCLRKKNFQYQVSWNWLNPQDQTLILYLNEEANAVLRFSSPK